MKRILVGVDATAESSFVLERAVALAETLDAKIRLARALPLPPTLPMPALELWTDSNAAAVEIAETELRELLARVPEARRDGVIAEVGTPADVVCSVARTYGADVVVIGAHKHGAIARTLGTTAARIVDRIDRSVMVVRQVPEVVEASGPSPRAPGVRAHDEHTLLEAATLAGAASGTAIGAIAGPPGALIGGVVGTAIGLVAGQALDDADARTSAHDRDLDDTIGVTRGDLGAREQAVRGFAAIARGVESDNGEILRAGALLKRQHEYLEKTYQALLAAYASGDWNEVRLQWSVFEPAILAHMDTEESEVLPAFRAAAPSEAEALLADHTELRRVLGTLGVAIDLHAVTPADAQELVARLRAHGAREELALYPWMDTSFDANRLSTAAA